MLNLALRVQKRSRAWSFALFAITVVLIFFWRPNSCASYLLNWLGLAPAQFLLTGLAANGAWWLMPHHPNSAHPVLQVSGACILCIVCFLWWLCPGWGVLSGHLRSA